VQAAGILTIASPGTGSTAGVEEIAGSFFLPTLPTRTGSFVQFTRPHDRCARTAFAPDRHPHGLAQQWGHRMLSKSSWITSGGVILLAALGGMGG